MSPKKRDERQKELPLITASQVNYILELRLKTEQAKQMWESDVAELAKYENKVIDLLERGARVAKTAPPTSVRRFKRKVIKWKEEFVKRLGLDKADEVVRKTKATVYKQLVILEVQE